MCLTVPGSNVAEPFLSTTLFVHGSWANRAIAGLAQTLASGIQYCIKIQRSAHACRDVACESRRTKL